MPQRRSGPPTWKEVVAEALRELGGEGHLSEINRLVEGHEKAAANPTWQDTIRRVVREYRIFQPVPPNRSGIYKLVEEATTTPREQELDSPDATINHDTAQGMLVMLGKVYGYETFVPAQDQAKRSFQEKKLAELVSVKDCSDVFKGPNLTKVREVDVIWFDEDDYGIYPVYAFEVEHTTKVRNGLDRLLKIPDRYKVGMFIIAPGEEEKVLFDRLVGQTPFRRFRDRFRFRPYAHLQGVYNAAITHQKERDTFGVGERNTATS